MEKNNKIRFAEIERKIMEVELILDGLYTHENFHPGCMRPAHKKRIKQALSAILSARAMLRNDLGAKQRTLTTRGSIKSRWNRHGLWDCNAVPEWKCDCGIPFQRHKVAAKIIN